MTDAEEIIIIDQISSDIFEINEVEQAMKYNLKTILQKIPFTK